VASGAVAAHTTAEETTTVVDVEPEGEAKAPAKAPAKALAAEGSPPWHSLLRSN
jgi:hypothetical protein